MERPYPCEIVKARIEKYREYAMYLKNEWNVTSVKIDELVSLLDDIQGYPVPPEPSVQTESTVESQEGGDPISDLPEAPMKKVQFPHPIPKG